MKTFNANLDLETDGYEPFSNINRSHWLKLWRILKFIIMSPYYLILTIGKIFNFIGKIIKIIMTIIFYFLVVFWLIFPIVCWIIIYAGVTFPA